MTKHYWFKPAKFWKWFAFYYPSSREGWVATEILIALMVTMFVFVESHSHSISDTLIGFAPWFISFGLIFDLLCFRTGKFPNWWKHKEE